jgi:acetyltransferase-like isoleucine patch superfamily enzyme
MKLLDSKLRRYILLGLPNFLWPLKKYLLKITLKKCGKNVKIGPNVDIANPHLVTIGNNVFIGDRSTIAGVVEISIGDNVMFGPEVMLRAGDHNIRKVGVPMRFVKTGGINMPIIIEKDVWVGARTMILKGNRIMEGAVIGASSVITKDFLPYTINVGNPARILRTRFNKNDLIKHLKLVKSKYLIDDIEIMYKENGIDYCE